MSLANLPFKKMRIRSLYGFEPEMDGYIGWTKEATRDSFLGTISDDDIILIYGATAAETLPAVRAKVIGFAQVKAKPIMDKDRSDPRSLEKKIELGYGEKWTYAIPITRAWKVTESLQISTIAFESYRSEAGQALAVYGAELTEDEVAEALKIKVREVNVFGEPPIHDQPSTPTFFGEVFKPSRAFPGAVGTRTANYEDGPTQVYLAAYTGDGHALIGMNKSYLDKSMLLKIGVTRDPLMRCNQLNVGFPPAAPGKWFMKFLSQPFECIKEAETVEEQFKRFATGKLKSLGGEFFWGDYNDAQSLLAGLPGMARFGTNKKLAQG